MSEQSQENVTPDESGNGDPAAEQENVGTLSVEDEPGGTSDPAELAGTAGPEDDR